MKLPLIIIGIVLIAVGLVSLAYQGIARGLGVEAVLELNLHGTRGLLPDRTILLLLDPAESARRAGETDRIEPAFLQVVMQQLWIEETRIWKASPGSRRRLRLSTLENGLHGARAVIEF